VVLSMLHLELLYQLKELDMMVINGILKDLRAIA
jgi:hypothetical protein